MKELTTYIRAGFSCVFIRSHEDTRVESMVAKIASGLQFSLYTWDIVNGIMSVDSGQSIGDTASPFEMLTAFDGLPDRSILLAKDLHPFLGDGSPADPSMVGRLKSVVRKAASRNRVLVSTGCVMAIPKEIERICAAIEFELPDRDTLREVLDGVLKSSGQSLSEEETESVLDAARGLTTSEAENAFALSIVTRRKIDPKEVSAEKVKAVRKGGILQIEDKLVPVSDIGGLDLLKGYLLGKSKSFTQAARDYGIPTPRGVLVVGQPGTGKSLCSKAASSVYGLPLLTLKADSLFGGVVGQTEGNWRSAFSTAKGCAPCVLRIDEVDGLFSGGESSGKTDGGTTARLLKSILQDMQENSEGIFYFFTANDLDRLPDPLLSRVDVFYVDLPNHAERAEIWRIHITKERGPEKRRRDPKKLKIDIDELAAKSKDFSGREIEQVFVTAMEAAYSDGGREVAMADIVRALESTVATAVVTRDVVEARRRKLQGRSRPASSPMAEAATATTRKIIQ